MVCVVGGLVAAAVAAADDRWTILLSIFAITGEPAYIPCCGVEFEIRGGEFHSISREDYIAKNGIITTRLMVKIWKKALSFSV